jgi:hypothetical protein
MIPWERMIGPSNAKAEPALLRRLLVFSGLLGGVMRGMSNTPEAKDDPLDRYRWRSRVLVVLAADPASPALAEQKRQLDALPGGARERDLVLVQALAGSAEAKALRARLGVGEGAFKAVLVGKDGGAKLSSDQPIGARELAATIDAMPMRQDEMRQRSRPR